MTKTHTLLAAIALGLVSACGSDPGTDRMDTTSTPDASVPDGSVVDAATETPIPEIVHTTIAVSTREDAYMPMQSMTSPFQPYFTGTDDDTGTGTAADSFRKNPYTQSGDWAAGISISKALVASLSGGIAPECIFVTAARDSAIPGAVYDPAAEWFITHVDRIHTGRAFGDEDGDGVYDYSPFDFLIHGFPGGNYTLTIAPSTCGTELMPPVVGAPLIIPASAAADSNGFVTCDGDSCALRMAVSDCGCIRAGANHEHQKLSIFAP